MKPVEPLTTAQLVDKQGEAFAELARAAELQRIGCIAGKPVALTELQRQELYVATSAQRCPRCGGHVVTFFPSPGVLCRACSAFFQQIDAGVRWFCDLLAEARKEGGQ